VFGDNVPNNQFAWSSLPSNFDTLFPSVITLDVQSLLSLTTLSTTSTTLRVLNLGRCITWNKSFAGIPNTVNSIQVAGTFNDANVATSVSNIDTFVDNYNSWVSGTGKTLNIGSYTGSTGVITQNPVPTGIWQSGSSTPMEQLFTLVNNGTITTFVRNFYLITSPSIGATTVTFTMSFNYGLRIGDTVRVYNTTGISNATSFTITNIVGNLVTINATVTSLTLDTTNSDFTLRSQIYRLNAI